MYNNFMNKKISDKIINRLTLYHCILEDYILKNRETISSIQIAKLLKIDDSQVRKDLNLLSNSGKNKVGYSVIDLKKSIEKNLGFTKSKKAIVIGAGNLGMALANYDNFIYYGLHIAALFDTDNSKIGKTINNKKILDIKELPVYVWNEFPEVAILTVPAKSAQKTAEYISKVGIKYIWNFTPVILDLPENVQIKNENLMSNFLQFTYNLK